MIYISNKEIELIDTCKFRNDQRTYKGAFMMALAFEYFETVENIQLENQAILGTQYTPIRKGGFDVQLLHKKG